MRELRELVLPLVVDAKQRQSLYAEREATPERTASRLRSRSYSSLGAAAAPSPSTPLTPLTPRTHGRFPSSASSLASSPTMRESLDGFGAKRPLTEVREEPTDGRDDAVGTFPTYASSPAVVAERGSPSRAGSTAATSFEGPNPAAERCLAAAAHAHEVPAGYDWMERIYDIDDFDFSVAKRRRGDEAPRPDAAGPLGARLRTLSRRFRSRKETSTPSLPEAWTEPTTRSRASSMRTTSLADFRSDGSISRDANPLPTPNASFVVEPTDDSAPEVSMEDETNDAASAATRTPLLPPLVAPLQKLDEEIASPLQSPKIVTAPSSPPFSGPAPGSPTVAHGLPSPPLSTKASVASFHRRTTAAATAGEPSAVHRPVVSTSDIPPIMLAQPPDEWSQKLGHANFTIHPEPYPLGPNPTRAMLQGLASDWALARRHFAQHLASTGEHYGAMSKVHALTRRKWEAIEGQWRAAYREALVQLPPAPVEQHPALKARSMAVPTSKQGPVVSVSGPRPSPTPITEQSPGSTLSMPPLPTAIEQSAPLPIQARASRTLIHARCDAKFPQIRLEDVVGPMTRVAPQPQSPPRSSRKRAFWRFLQGILPENGVLRKREAVC